MPLIVREANLECELDVVRATVNACFRMALSAERFRWLYLQNPDGPAVAWLAIDERCGTVAGTTAALPRRVWLGRTRREVRAWNCGDFSVMPRYRTMGTAIKLRRAARSGVDAGQSPFLYAHPNDRMLAVHLQVGHRPLGKMVRYAKPLRTSTGWRAIDHAAALALRGAGKRLWRAGGHETELVREWPLSELDELFEEASARVGTAVVRDSRYLDWRFRQHPLEPSEMMVARRGGKLAAYLIGVVKGEIGVVKDWLAVDASAVDDLFRGLIAEMRSRDVASVSVTALESHPHLPRLKALGFLRRPDSTMAVVHAGPELADRQEVIDQSAWYMTFGDRDV